MPGWGLVSGWEWMVIPLRVADTEACEYPSSAMVAWSCWTETFAVFGSFRIVAGCPPRVVRDRVRTVIVSPFTTCTAASLKPNRPRTDRTPSGVTPPLTHFGQGYLRSDPPLKSMEKLRPRAARPTNDSRMKKPDSAN